jgi:hypothetical protein
MNSQDFRDLGDVLEAGARSTWGWLNSAAPVLGSVLEAMARKCDEIAAERAAQEL